MCIALLEPKPGQIDQYGGYGVSMVQGGPSQEQRMQLQTAAVLGILPYCARLLAMLDDREEPEEQVRAASLGFERQVSRGMLECAGIVFQVPSCCKAAGRRRRSCAL